MPRRSATFFSALALALALAGSASAAPKLLPKPPDGLDQIAATASSVTMRWSAPREGARPVSYNVYRDGAFAGSTAGTTFTIRSLACGEDYRIEVETVDASGNRSQREREKAETADCPRPPRDVDATATADSIRVTWKPSGPTVSYGVYLDDRLAGSTASTSFTFTSLKCGQRYRVEVDALDSAGNRSRRAGDSVSTRPCPPAPPRPPDNLTAVQTTQDSIAIVWTVPLADILRGRTFGVYLNGTLVDTTRLIFYRYRLLACGTTYLLEVDAVDPAGNRSSRTAIHASTAACTPPVVKPLAVAPNGSDYVWAHLAATYDGATLRLYLNGAQVSSAPVTGTMAPSSGPLQIGGNRIWGEWFAGLIDNVRVYDRSLTPAEVAADVTRPVTAGASPGLVAAYNFDEGTGAKAADASGRGNDGALNGATWAPAGRFGGAVALNGASDLVSVADSASLDLAGAMTLEAWVRPSKLEPIWRTVLIKENGADMAYALYGNNTDANAPSAHVFTDAEHNVTGTGPLPGNSCTPEPCATFDRAYRAAKPGDVVEVAAGTYPDQTILFDPAKTSADDVVFRPAAGAAPVVGSVFLGTDRHTAGASHLTLDGLTVDGDVSIPGCGVPDGTACPPDAQSPGNDLTFRNLRVKGPYSFVCASCSNVSLLGGTWGPDTYECRPGTADAPLGSAHPEIQSAAGQDKRAHGILIDGVTWQNFARCTADDHTECLQIEPADDLTIRNSIFRKCDTMDVNIANDLANASSAAGYRAPNNILIENNVFAVATDFLGGPTFYALNIRECTNCTVRYNSWLQAPRMPTGEISLNNRFIANVGPMTPDNCFVEGVTFSHNVWDGPACGPTDKTAVALGFLNPAALDLHLAAGSPAIDAGDPASFPATDIDGDHRPQGAAPDAGADERR